MPTTGRAIALLAVTMIAMPGLRSEGVARAQGANAEDRVSAGGVVPAANALSAPRPASLNPEAGATLFSTMNCDGCHGGGAVGWVGPSLVDGRWRYGGSDDEIFTSIFYGRPKGMPAYGGVIGPDGVWNLVAYIKAQGVPTVVPTTSWLKGGNAAPTPAAAHEGEAAPGEAAPVPPAAAAPVPAAAAPAAPVAPDQLAAKYGCTGCHATDRKVIGPSFKDVANKYRGKNVEAALAEKIRKGGAGAWGEMPMPPNPQVPDPDLHALVKWILSLK
ncbi:MAG: cytochrome c [Gemmatimonadales bacterium]|nr:cytochrome c [Gemmatimonadales bacterium]